MNEEVEAEAMVTEKDFEVGDGHVWRTVSLKTVLRDYDADNDLVIADHDDLVDFATYLVRASGYQGKVSVSVNEEWDDEDWIVEVEVDFQGDDPEAPGKYLASEPSDSRTKPE